MSLQQIKSLSDAKNVVNALRSSPGDAQLHHAAKSLCSNDTWGWLCEADYPQFMAEYAESWGVNDMGPTGLPAWHLSASETAIALQASSTSASKSPLNIRAVTLLRHVVTSKLLKAILATREVVLVDPQTSLEKEKVDACITAASGLLFAVCHSLKVHQDEAYLALLRSSGALEIALLCWYHTPHLATRISSSITLESLLSPSRSSASTQSPLSRLTSMLPPQSIVTKCHQMLKNGIKPPGQMTSGHRLVEMCLVQWLCDEKFKEGWGVWLVRGDLQRTVVEVVQYELASSKKGGGWRGESEEASISGSEESKGGTVMNWELVDMAGAVLLALSNVADLPVATLIEYIQKLDLLKLLSQIFVEESLNADAQPWSNILDLLSHCTTCVATNCHYVRTDAYISALRFALEDGSLWANSLIRMQELSKAKAPGDLRKTEGRKSRLRAWYAIGKEAGLTSRLPRVSPGPSAGVTGGGTGRGRHREAVDGCWWEQCGRHGRVDEEIEQILSRCSQCKTARYCSGACQKADWTVHKAECKKLNGG